MTRRVLVVAYYFPPLGGGGVQRTLKHATYLPQAGWEPVVLTARNPDYEIRDPALLAQVPADLEIHRSFIWEPTRLYRRAAALYAMRPGGRARAAGVGSPSPLTQAPTPPAGRRKEIGIWANLSRYLIFPDYQILWLPFAVSAGLGIQRDRPAQALYSSGPPITTHLIAGVLKARTGLPWVADFRDPWIGNAFALPLPGPHRRLRRRVERWIVSRADRVVFATPSLTEMYRGRYPDLASRFATISNGYDPAELPARGSRAAWPRPARLVYSGSLYGERELEIFLEGLRRLCGTWPDVRNRLRVEFVGWLSSRNQSIAEWYISSGGLDGMIILSGFVSHAEALARLQAADAALHLLADDPGKDLFVAGKVYEYIGMNLPTFAMLPQGDARAVLDRLNWGIVVGPDPDEVAAGIRRLLTSPPASGIADPDGVYDRRHLAGELADELSATQDGARRA